jgi:4'-phosphopantetheinyl transferase
MMPAPLPGEELHVWRASLDRSAEVVESLERVLGRDERERADRFRFEHHRARYVVGRALLRGLLGRYLGTRPEDIEFSYGEHGKPFLACPGPWFNLAHSGPVAMFAFSSTAEVGIDVELADADFASGRIAERFFAPSEVQRLRSLPMALQPRAFLECWTRKEAFIKARGEGLSLPLDSFAVTLGPSEPAAVLRTAWSDEEPMQWSMADLSDPGGQSIAAVASRSGGWSVVCRAVAEIDDEQIATEREDT